MDAQETVMRRCHILDAGNRGNKASQRECTTKMYEK
jgi:hypothetical protein